FTCVTGLMLAVALILSIVMARAGTGPGDDRQFRLAMLLANVRGKPCKTAKPPKRHSKRLIMIAAWGVHHASIFATKIFGPENYSPEMKLALVMPRPRTTLAKVAIWMAVGCKYVPTG